VIVTGAARGIGEGCARVFFEAGASVVIVDRDEKGGAALAAELNGQDWSLDEASGRAKFVKADVSVAAELEAAVAATVAAFGRVDCVVNNAGWHPPHKPIDDFSVDDVQDLLQLNFVSAFALCKFALPHLRETKGCIVNMSSLVGHFGQAKACTYAATKGALTAFTKALAIDEAPNGVRVNSVSPGNIWTPLWKAGADADADPAAARAAGDRAQVMGRMGTILEAGRLCLCIAADMTFTTGVDHILSGGAEIGYGMRA
jgi:NAD(P)-dependent dehydrogenase (short-subunit alcohol dehydrogenase family)